MIRPGFRSAVVFLMLSATLVGAAAQQASAPAGQTRPAQTNPPPQGPPPAPPQDGAAQPQQGQPPPQDPNAPPAQPTFRTGINFVRVDAIVSDNKGRPVADLKPEDFEVMEDGKPQSIETFKLIRVDGNPPPGEAAPREINSIYAEESEARRDDVRLFVIFFDDYHVRLGASLAVKDPLVKFIETQVGPLDMIAMMYPLDPLRAVSFTRNKKAVIQQILSWQGRKYQYIPPRNVFEEQYANYPVEVVEKIRNQVSLSALRGLMTRLGGMREGRKTVIVVAEGYTDYVPPQMRGTNAQSGIKGVGTSAMTADASVDPVGAMAEDRTRFFGDMDIRMLMRDVTTDANRNNVSLYMLDPRGLAGFEFDINEGVGLTADSSSLRTTQDSLRVMADETDGRAIVNRNDLGGGLAQMMRDASAYYLIGYSSAAAPTDGRFHQIRVRVKRPGIEVRARRGYWALRPDEAAAVTAGPKVGPPPDVNVALSEIAKIARAKTVRTWVGYAPDASGKTRVMFSWEPVTGGPGEAPSVGEPVSQVTVMAVNESEGPVYRGKVPAAAASATPSPGGGQTSFLIAPGAAQVKVSAEATGGGVLQSDLIDLAVPDFAKDAQVVGTPALFRARTARDLQALATAANAQPTAARQFSRTEKLLLRVHITGGEPAIRLMSQTGDGMSPLVVRAAPPGSPFTHEVEIPLASLPAGDFLIEVKVGSAPDAPRRLTGVKVTG
ncbi:VWFA-related Acidobacterial domain protein [Luteitalea pratensis]|uniref:VWFA-related Acidobacterial domain protein n=2 Tax=Luteitalea pratensis TaxID=1855912 RepID=A0A143PTV5_LUTPR|nr:VWFA-related Acidobacterial domain protein [Luteitalea pratensis]